MVVYAGARSAENMFGDRGVRNAERDLTRWCHRQRWRQLAPKLYTFPLVVRAWVIVAGTEPRHESFHLPQQVCKTTGWEHSATLSMRSWGLSAGR